MFLQLITYMDCILYYNHIGQEENELGCEQMIPLEEDPKESKGPLVALAVPLLHRYN